MTRRATAQLLSLLFAVTTIGCASQELRAVIAAREAYTECVAEHSESHPDCEDLRRHHLAEQQRYEENSRRAWSCGPPLDECPTPR